MQSPTFVPFLSDPEFKPYLLETLLDFIEDQGNTPYIYVRVTDDTVVPREYVNPDNSIVLCASRVATNKRFISETEMTFQCRFNERIANIQIPLQCILAVYPKENPDQVSYFAFDEESFNKNESVTENNDNNDVPTFTKL